MNVTNNKAGLQRPAAPRPPCKTKHRHDLAPFLCIPYRHYLADMIHWLPMAGVRDILGVAEGAYYGSKTTDLRMFGKLHLVRSVTLVEEGSMVAQHRLAIL